MGKRCGEPKSAPNCIWPPDDERDLMWHWEHATMPALMKRFSRTAIAIWDKATSLGLRSVPNGYESINATAERTGYDPDQLARIFELGGLHPRRCISDPREPHPGGRERRFVDPERVDDAIRLWEATEWVTEGARRVGVETKALRRHLLRAVNDPTTLALWPSFARYLIPPDPGRKWRLPTTLVDAVVVAYKRRKNKAHKAPATTETPCSP